MGVNARVALLMKIAFIWVFLPKVKKIVDLVVEKVNKNVVLMHHARMKYSVTLMTILAVFVRVALLMEVNFAIILVFLPKEKKIVNLFVKTVITMDKNVAL